MSKLIDPKNLTKKDFETDQDVRWCPGCGDYSILANVQKVMPELGISPDNIVWISGIGCSSRFPYYMDTYGFHTIHGRAPSPPGSRLPTPTSQSGWPRVTATDFPSAAITSCMRSGATSM